MNTPPAPLLVLAWGNRSRGDDALGPLLLDALQAWVAARHAAGQAVPQVEFIEDYQLQIEHALDLVGRQRVLFIDASLTGPAPFEAGPVRPARDTSFTSHALSPQAVLQTYREVCASEPPPATLLAIRGERFELGEGLGAAAQSHLQAALPWVTTWLASER